MKIYIHYIRENSMEVLLPKKNGKWSFYDLENGKYVLYKDDVDVGEFFSNYEFDLPGNFKLKDKYSHKDIVMAIPVEFSL